MIMLKLMTTILTLLVILSSSSADAKLKVQNLQHGQSPVVSVRFMPDRKSLLTASFNGTVVRWDLRNHKPLWKVDLDAETKKKESHTISEILDMDVSLDGATIAVAYSRSRVVGNSLNGQSEYRIGLLDSRDGRELRVLPGHAALIGTIAFSPDGTLLASASSDFTARLWNVQTGSQVWSIKLRGLGRTIAFSPNQELLAIGMLSNGPWHPVVEVHSAQTGSLEREIDQGRANVSDIAFSPHNENLAVATSDAYGSQVELWNLHTKTLESSLVYEMDINSIAFTPKGDLLALGGSKHGKGEVVFLSLQGRSSAFVRPSVAEINNICFSHDGTLLVVGADNGEIAFVKSQAAPRTAGIVNRKGIRH